MLRGPFLRRDGSEPTVDNPDWPEHRLRVSETSVMPCWQAVGMVVDQNTKDFLAGRYGLVQEMVAWFKAVDLFRAAVDERMVLREPAPEDLRQHRTWITSLLAEGERLVTEANQAGGLPEGLVRFRLEDVEATIESLRGDERMWHSPMSPATKALILNEVFHGQTASA
jgi:hypothetical protein